MAFQEIKPLEDPDKYLDIAFSKATKKARSMSLRKTNSLDRLKNLESTKIQVVKDTLVTKLDSILETFPSEKDMTEFYKKLISITITNSKLNNSLINVSWTKNKINALFKQYEDMIKKSKELKYIKKHKTDFYGRASSLLKHLKSDFIFLKEARGVLQSFPVIKTRLKQMAIAGFPNVGKTTLLGKLSKSKPEVAGYAFTTKKTMIGYIEEDGKKKVQLLDTPGTLNRLNKMNYIEQQAYFVMKMVADKIIYVFDLTEPYPIEDQIKLFERVKEFNKPVIIYLSKTDILDKEKVSEFKKKYECVDDFKELKKIISV